MWNDGEEQETDYKRASRLFSPKGINYQTAYQDQASKNNDGVIFAHTSQKILLFVKKKEISKDKDSDQIKIYNEWDLFGDKSNHISDLKNSCFLFLIGPKLSIPVLKNFLQAQLADRNMIYEALFSAPCDKTKVRNLHLAGVKDFLYRIISNFNAKVHMEYKEQPITVMGWIENQKNFFIVKPSNKITESPIIYEGNLSSEEMDSFLKTAKEKNLWCEEEQKNFVFKEDLRYEDFYKEYSFYQVDKHTQEIRKIA